MKLLVLVVISFLYNNILVFSLKACPPITIKNGFVKYRSKGRMVRIRCNRGFTLDGENYGACIRGEWDIDLPTCVFRSLCSPITEIRNGHVIANKQWSTLRFICNSGYHLVGQSQLQCKNSKWNGEPPQCQTSVQLSCDFESRGLCGWDNSTKSGYYWLKRQYATPSHYLDTGPGHDHTLHPKNNGHYLYIETSGLYGKDMKTTIARIFSPLLPPVENNGTCFTFWYHMFGSTIGELIIYVDGHKVFHKSGNQGNRWIKGFVKNLPTDTFYQITIEGVPGSGWTGDIAIDDLNITTSVECTRPTVEDTTCDGRCYEEEAKNSTLCQCNEKCIATETCCSDFFDVCNADVSTTGLPFSTNEDITENIFTSVSTEDYSSGLDYTTVDYTIITYDNLVTETSTETEIKDFTNLFPSSRVLDNSFSVKTQSDVEGGVYVTTEHSVINKESSTEVDITESINDNGHTNYSEIRKDLVTEILGITETESKLTEKENILQTTEIIDLDTTEGYLMTSVDHSVEESNPPVVPPQTTTLVTTVTKFNSTSTLPQRNVNYSINTLETLAPHTHLHKVINITHTVQPMIPLVNDSFEETNNQTEKNSKLYTYDKPTTNLIPKTMETQLSTTSKHTFTNKTNSRYQSTTETVTETLPITIFVKLARTESTRWKSKYQPKGYYTYSAIKQEQTNGSGLKNIAIIITIAVIFIIGSAIGLYLYRRRSFLHNTNNVEEADVLFIPTDEFLDFSVSRLSTTLHRREDVNKVVVL